MALHGRGPQWLLDCTSFMPTRDRSDGVDVRIAKLFLPLVDIHGGLQE